MLSTALWIKDELISVDSQHINKEIINGSTASSA